MLRVQEMTKDAAQCKIYKSYGGRVDYTICSGDKKISVSCFSEPEAWQDAYERLIGDRPRLQGV